MGGAPSARAAWEELARAELGSSPLSALVARRSDGLELPAIEFHDPGRPEGLGSAPAVRSIARIVDADASWRTEPTDAEVLWIRGQPADLPPDGTVIEPTTTPISRASLPPDLLVLSDPSTEALLDGRASDAASRSWHARDAISVAGVHERGAGPVTQVALAIAAMLDRGRALTTARPPAFVLAISPELFVEIAKVRALRRLADRVLATLAEAGAVPIFARSDVRSQSRLDPATNAIRATLSVTAAMLGGADCVGALPMDLLETSGSTRGARLARNTPLVLSLESHLTSVDDPSRGSYLIESLTDRIAREAWDLTREIERRGGLSQARAWTRERLESEATRRREAVRSRRIALVGASRFAVADERLSDAPRDHGPRDAQAFEVFHTDGVDRPVALVVLGPLPAVEARVAFAREVLEAGGLHPVAADDAGARVALIAAPDDRFATQLVEEASALRRRGLAVFVAGKPGAHEAAHRDAGVEGFLFVGADVVQVLAEMRRRAGGAAS